MNQNARGVLNEGACWSRTIARFDRMTLLLGRLMAQDCAFSSFVPSHGPDEPYQQSLNKVCTLYHTTKRTQWCRGIKSLWSNMKLRTGHRDLQMVPLHWVSILPMPRSICLDQATTMQAIATLGAREPDFLSCSLRRNVPCSAASLRRARR